MIGLAFVLYPLTSDSWLDQKDNTALLAITKLQWMHTHIFIIIYACIYVTVHNYGTAQRQRCECLKPTHATSILTIFTCCIQC